MPAPFRPFDSPATTPARFVLALAASGLLAGCGGNLLGADPVEILTGETYRGEVLTAAAPALPASAPQTAPSLPSVPADPPPPVETVQRPTGSGSYPKLGEVPVRPANLPTTAERAAAISALEAERRAAERLQQGVRTTFDTAFGQTAPTGLEPVPPRSGAPGSAFPAPPSVPGVAGPVLGSVRFAQGSDALDVVGIGEIRRIAADAAGRRLQVVGRTGGLQRVRSVIAALVAAGIDPERIAISTDDSRAADTVDIHAGQPAS